MSIISRAGSAFFTYKFLALLVQDWKDTDAYKLGIIDENGTVLKKIRDLETSEEKVAYSMFNRLVFNIKRALAKLPFGKSKLASYAAALYLIKEHTHITDENIMEVLEAAGVDVGNYINESSDEWFVIDNKLGKGRYKLATEVASPISGEITGRKGHVVVVESSDPVCCLLGVNIYKALHQASGQTLYITSRNIKR